MFESCDSDQYSEYFRYYVLASTKQNKTSHETRIGHSLRVWCSEFPISTAPKSMRSGVRAVSLIWGQPTVG